MTRIGIADVAQAAGVSEATVSRVVNNRGTVAAATRKAVEEAMRTVGYVRAHAGSLVMLVTPGLFDPFFAQMADRIVAGLGLHGLRGVICSAPAGGAQELDFGSAVIEAGAVGAIFVSASNTLENADPGVYRLLESRSVPYVCINGAAGGSHGPVLSTDDRLAAEMSVDHLWRLGHRRIGLIAGPRGNRPSDRRVDGFRAAMKARGAGTEDAPVARHEYSIEGGVSAASRLCEDPALTAIVAASDEMALGAVRSARWAGLQVPADLSVVGYDDALPLEFFDPPLTSVRQPTERIAAAVVQMLIGLIRGRQVDETELFFSPELIVRSSTGPVPTADR
ncbi:LacI family DNA-binding transcriptional regulator [Streptomyces sp. NPDC026672]|uniref:LacI family DNA-binding transcriptional regulator n=1 Tax=unclassified Streptomyces TaxID=2593676 RepID=UPI0033DC6904